jgi:AcrR family transcriptional regulator
LVHYAKKIFASRGYYATSISQIVQEAGIARGTFYQYFDNKPHIFQSILDAFVQDLQECIRPINTAPGSMPPVAQIQDNLTRVFSLVQMERDLTQILLHNTGTGDCTVEKRLDDFYTQVVGMIERSLNLGMAMKLVRPCNARLTAYAIIGAVKEVVFQLTSSHEPQPPVEDLVSEILQFGMGGILADARSPLLDNSQRSAGLGLRPEFGSGAKTSRLPS